MTGIVDTVKGLVRGSTDVLTKIEALEDAAEAGRGRLDQVVLSEASQIVDRASQRLRMSGDLTIVALAGATGSGTSPRDGGRCPSGRPRSRNPQPVRSRMCASDGGGLCSRRVPPASLVRCAA